ncbi:hypothetical protein C461_14011 [Halorubrum aidingense JCM 13560]|uniref:Uncharacterized protein n=1 Tax=Halorubrum aidingense JCM 13560 TaxID=1230454 RepID=M0P6Y2_9EURY|nr:hypothetical protein [Halorubrum aidingense]EMA65821.1 hypothetical protein C461_14011 [Halorubrum aidingense JCM 13560]
MSRSSGEVTAGDERAAVEPIAALVAVLAVGAALGLYTVALDDATPDTERPAAEATLDRIEPDVTTGGVVDPTRLNDIEFRFATALELTADGERWRVDSGDDAPESTAAQRSGSVAVAERTVTVRVDPGRNVRGTIRAVVRR